VCVCLCACPSQLIHLSNLPSQQRSISQSTYRYLGHVKMYASGPVVLNASINSKSFPLSCPCTPVHPSSFLLILSVTTPL
jgi:hypothetical protein